MAHYAFLDENNIVTEVIVGRDEDEIVEGISDWATYYGAIRKQRCLRTSYNTAGNTHLNGGEPFRGNMAAIGYYYDEELDVFIPPKPYESFVLDSNSFTWVPPKPVPIPGKRFWWDEENLEWVAIEDE